MSISLWNGVRGESGALYFAVETCFEGFYFWSIIVLPIGKMFFNYSLINTINNILTLSA